MNTNKKIYNKIKKCKYYENIKRYPNSTNIWTLDTYNDILEQKLCEQLEINKLLNNPTEKQLHLHNIFLPKTNKPFTMTQLDKRNYGNEYENIYNDTYKNMYEPFHNLNNKQYLYGTLIILLVFFLCNKYL